MEKDNETEELYLMSYLPECRYQAEHHKRDKTERKSVNVKVKDPIQSPWYQFLPHTAVQYELIVESVDLNEKANRKEKEKSWTKAHTARNLGQPQMPFCSDEAQ